MKKLFTIISSLLLIILIGVISHTSKNVNAEVISEPASLTEVPDGYIGIYTMDDLDKVRQSLSGKYILMNDIDLSKSTDKGGLYDRNGAGWEPIGSKETPFTGIFDGNNYKIIGLKMAMKSESPIYAGLFGAASNSQLRNISIKDTIIYAENTSYDSSTSKVYAGGIVGYGYNVNISNVKSSGKIEASSLFTGYAGGIIGYADTKYNEVSTITNSYNAAEVRAKSSAGGIAGEMYRTTIENAINEGNIQAAEKSGGIVGYSRTESTISNSKNTGSITFTSSGGGIAGSVSSTLVSNTFNLGSINSSTTWASAGGIAGKVSSSIVSKSYNKGPVTSLADSSNAGGIAGYNSSSSSLVQVYNLGDIKGGISAGGIAGDSMALIRQAYNAGNVSSASFVGGIAGWSWGAITTDCFNTGNITAKYTAGGIVGIGRNSSTLQNCYNIGPRSNSTLSSKYGDITGEFEGSIKNVYYFNGTRVVENATNETNPGKSLEQMLSASTFTGFDFESTWRINKDHSFKFPELQALPFQGEEKTIRLELTTRPEKTTYLQGEDLELGNTAITAYTSFGNWSEIKVTKDMISNFNPNSPGYQTVTITYNGFRTYFSVNVLRAYDVIFKDYNGDILKTERVALGGTAAAPESPTRDGYIFQGWDKPLENIRSNTTITALYEMISYQISYMDGDQVLYTEQYSYGTELGLHYTPDKPGYTFAGWYKDKDFQERFAYYTPVYSPITLYAKFFENPGIPGNVTVTTQRYDQLKVAWTPVEGAVQYEVHRATSKNGPYNYIAGVNGSTTNYIFDELNTGTTYYFKVVATYQMDVQTIYGGFSPIISGKPELNRVSSVKASVTYDQVRLTWKQAAGANGYEIYRSSSANGTYRLIQTMTSDRTTSFTNSQLATGTAYYYKIRAYRLVNGKKVYGPFSSTVSGKPVLSKVTSIKASSAGFDKIRITWSKVNGAHGYVVYRSTSKNGSYTQLTTVTNASTLSFVHTKAATGTTYYYKVKAYRFVNGKKIYGPYSSISSGKAQLSAPTRLNAKKNSSTSSRVSWSPSAGASGYEIFRATSKNGKYIKITTINNGKTSSYTNQKLQKRKTYYYKMRSYRLVNGKKVYSSYTPVVTYKN
ncbi:fibronectin type III domain-containing protein [Neobacillus kokaensis]|uniref:Fibronectin type-III domain-containing protein n=1 Tax=Neobacillus kokaensis TaxID=2759023 RepID=A0ABQ3N6Q1_9BACI|nr:fibronectin type III domain-containing protein [Neobacillus kokaensis]GHH99736.1 hypothetical protein AM1BK_32790 [Neobacillus kokaensis]